MRYSEGKMVVFLCGLLLSSLLIASPVATVNGAPIQKESVDKILAELVKGGAKDSIELREKIKQLLIERELIIQDSLRRKLDKRSEFEEGRRNLLTQMFLAELRKSSPVRDLAVRNHYEDFKKNLKDTKDITFRQVLIKTEVEARKVIAAFKKHNTKDFDRLAKSQAIKSQTINSKALADNFPGLSKVLSVIRKGEVGENPVQVNEGWCIFRVDDIKDAVLPTFEELKPQIFQKLEEQVLRKAIDELRKKAVIK